MPAPEPLLFLITGSRGAGKTLACQRLVEAARQAGWQVAGMLSHGVYEGSRRVAIAGEDLRSGQRRTLALRRPDPDAPRSPSAASRHWDFDPAAMAWADGVLAAACPTDLLIVDELGWMEFDEGAGWQGAFPALDAGPYAVAVVVVRAEFLGHALLRWQEAHVVEIDTPDDVERKTQAIIGHLFS